MIGHVTEKNIFALAISNSFLRDQTICDMDMTGTEKVQLLKSWVYTMRILPVTPPSRLYTRCAQWCRRPWGLTLGV